MHLQEERGERISALHRKIVGHGRNVDPVRRGRINKGDYVALLGNQSFEAMA